MASDVNAEDAPVAQIGTINQRASVIKCRPRHFISCPAFHEDAEALLVRWLSHALAEEIEVSDRMVCIIAVFGILWFLVASLR